jgi:hypothetical protein
MSRRVTFLTEWDAAAMQTVELLPPGAHAELLTFEADPPPEDSSLPAGLAAALAAALCARGIVAARWFDSAPPPATARFLPAPPRHPLQRLRDSMPFAPKTWPASLALTRDPACAATFFETGWDLQYQSILLLPEDAGKETEGALEALRTTRDWRDFADLGAILALCAPAVDGGAILIATSTAAGLSDLAATLETALGIQP